ncbi:MAG: hypothetical protein IKR46_01515 [Clostridia bacterium]|nr:hypothetical protein [Clostridia bacterium]
MSIIESVKNYFENCPYFEDKAININYLSPQSGSFSIDNMPENPVVKRYSDGESLMQFCFLIAERIVYDGGITENLAVSQFFEEIESWIKEQDKQKNLPDLSNMGLTPTAIEVTKSGTLYDTARTSARIQIELRLLYKRKS